ncbi:MAG TPA: GNAT family N-acetyltransferase [Gaiellaceae bacterium]|nr:GNAT family N-acetyltransferase [Gaiellaceae bacterium]
MSPDDRVELSIPEGGIVFDEFVLGLPTAADLDRLSATYAEPDAFTRAELAELVPHMNALLAVGRLAPLLVKDARTGEILGGGTFRNFDADQAAVEIGYWLYPHARGRGVATRTARALAEHAFGLGVRHVVARVKVGNAPSERVLERAGFTCDGFGRAIPTAHGRIAKSIWSLRPAAEDVVLIAVDTLEDWPLWRSARLAALADASDAFPGAPADRLEGGEDRWRISSCVPSASGSPSVLVWVKPSRP